MCQKYVGAIAVSWYRAAHTKRAIEMLISAGVKTNIHYVLGPNTIDEAIERLTNHDFPDHINAIIFLLHKPIGLGAKENVLQPTDLRVKHFFQLIDTKKTAYKIGFDSCSCAGIVNYTNEVSMDSIDYCEGARYSCYIDAQMNIMPCSFANDDLSWSVSLNDHTIEQAWQSEPFQRFRYSLQNSCVTCKDRNFCGGGCPIINEITLCGRKERDFICQNKTGFCHKQQQFKFYHSKRIFDRKSNQSNMETCGTWKITGLGIL
jgi:radical SAM protein with 4Fe4S-binding SPASM domain